MPAFFAVTTPGLEAVTRSELVTLGLEVEESERGGVAFVARLADGLSANMLLRTATRVLLRVGEFTARSFPDLYKRTRRIDWTRFVGPGQAVDVRAAAHRSRLSHTRRIGETIVDAIGHAAATEPSLVVHARLVDDRCVLSVDTSGERLHLRGYRTESGPAPLRESVAAALLIHLGWMPDEPLLDPMCGAGTLPIEAAWIATGRAPGTARTFAFETWPCMDDKLRAKLRKPAPGDQDPGTVRLFASDADATAVKRARGNARRAGVEDAIEWDVAAVEDAKPPCARGLVVCNPPYGVRLGKPDSIAGAYAALGSALRRFEGWRAGVLCPGQGLERALSHARGGGPASRLTLEVGGRRLELLQFGPIRGD